MKLSEIIEALKARRKGISLDLSASYSDGKFRGAFQVSLDYFKELAAGKVEKVEAERHSSSEYPYWLRLKEKIEDLDCELTILALVSHEALASHEVMAEVDSALKQKETTALKALLQS